MFSVGTAYPVTKNSNTRSVTGLLVPCRKNYRQFTTISTRHQLTCSNPFRSHVFKRQNIAVLAVRCVTPSVLRFTYSPPVSAKTSNVFSSTPYPETSRNRVFLLETTVPTSRIHPAIPLPATCLHPVVAAAVPLPRGGTSRTPVNRSNLLKILGAGMTSMQV